MYIERDAEYNLLYLSFKDELQRGEVSETKEVSPGINLDFDLNGKLLGIEIVNTKTVLGTLVTDLRLSGELLGVKEAAELAHKDRANFLRDVASRPDFPDPVARVASGQLWLSRDVKRYLRTPRGGSDTLSSREHNASHERQTAHLPYRGWEGRDEDNYKDYRYKDHEQYEDYEVMDTSKSAPQEEKLLDDEDHEVFRPDQDPSEEQESA